MSLILLLQCGGPVYEYMVVVSLLRCVGHVSVAGVVVAVYSPYVSLVLLLQCGWPLSVTGVVVAVWLACMCH